MSELPKVWVRDVDFDEVSPDDWPELLRTRIMFTTIRSRFGRKGYQEDEVDLLLDRAADHIERLQAP